MEINNLKTVKKIIELLKTLEPSEEFGIAFAIMNSLYQRNHISWIDDQYVAILSSFEALSSVYSMLSQLKENPSLLEGLEPPNNTDGDVVVGTNGQSIDEILNRLVKFAKDQGLASDE